MQPGQGYSIEITSELDCKVYLIAKELVVVGRRLKFGVRVKDNADVPNSSLLVVGCFEHA